MTLQTEVLRAFGVESREQVEPELRRALGVCFCFIQSEDRPSFPEAGERALRVLGVREGERIPLSLRDAIGAVLGFEEPPLPPWAKPGEWVVFSDWGRPSAAKIKIVDDGGVAVEREEPVPTGVFLLRYKPLPRLKCQDVACSCVCDDGEVVAVEIVLRNDVTVIACPQCHHAHNQDALASWRSSLGVATGF